jgi:hypothetical protein
LRDLPLAPSGLGILPRLDPPLASIASRSLVQTTGMSGDVYYRDPRAPRDVQGPFPVDQLREFARDGRLRPGDQVSLDGQAWLAATAFEPPLFPEGPTAGTNSSEAWKRWLDRALRMIRTAALATWEHLKRVAKFYWANRAELRTQATEYLTFLQDHGERKELRVSSEDHNDHVYLYGDRWTAELPDCCVVCGNETQCEWNSEHRSVPDLTWALWAPIFGLVFACIGWLFLWDIEGRWLVPLGLFVGFLVGYQLQGQMVVAIRFRRCREHLNRTRYPSLRLFRKSLIIGVGDRLVWRKFYYGERGMETPAIPPDFLKVAETAPTTQPESEAKPSYPTIPLISDEEMEQS